MNYKTASQTAWRNTGNSINFVINDYCHSGITITSNTWGDVAKEQHSASGGTANLFEYSLSVSTFISVTDGLSLCKMSSCSIVGVTGETCDPSKTYVGIYDVT